MNPVIATYAFPDDDDATLENVLINLPGGLTSLMTEVPSDPIWLLTLPVVEAVQLKLACHQTLRSDRLGNLLVPDSKRSECLDVLDQQSICCAQWKKLITIRFGSGQAERGFRAGIISICPAADVPFEISLVDFN